METKTSAKMANFDPIGCFVYQKDPYREVNSKRSSFVY
jgi:hypothetical protein